MVQAHLHPYSAHPCIFQLRMGSFPTQRRLLPRITLPPTLLPMPHRAPLHQLRHPLPSQGAHPLRRGHLHRCPCCRPHEATHPLR